MNDTDAVLVADDLHKTYGRGEAAVHAVRGVDLTLRGGDFVAIMGTSGSGKSSLLHVLAGLLRPDRGAVRFEGRDLCALSDAAVTRLRRRAMGFVFQSYNLMPTLTARDNVALPLLLDRVDRARAAERADLALEQVSLAHRRDHLPRQMSGGEQQRVAIARALVTTPSLILADEPTGNLDRRNAQRVCELLASLAVDERRAVALVTHEPAVAAHAREVLVLADGRIADRFAVADVDGVEALAARYLRATDDDAGVELGPTGRPVARDASQAAG